MKPAKTRFEMNGWKATLILTAVASAALYLIMKEPDPRRLPESELFSKGQVAAHKGDCKKAIGYYQILLQKDSRHLATMEHLIECQLKLGDGIQASATLERLIELEPTRERWQRLLTLYRETAQSAKVRALLARKKELQVE